MGRIRKLFLDLDGPLLDGKKRHYHCYRTILEKSGFNPVSMDEYWEKKRAMVNRRDMLRLSGAESIYNTFLSEWLKIIETPAALSLDEVQEGALDCLEIWKEQGIGLTLVTLRSNRWALEEQLTRFKLKPLFDNLLVCDHAGGGTGKAKAVRKMHQFDFNGNNALWIGDTEVDWEAAGTLGCPVVLLSNGVRSEEYLASLQGAIVMPSIASLKNRILEVPNVS